MPVTGRSSSLEGKRGYLFVAIGLVLYAALVIGSEALVWRRGHANAFYKIEAARQSEFDWVIVGASHAMPLDFDGFNGEMERNTGLSIINLAAPGAGPQYNRFVLDHFFRDHRALNVMYVLDEFGLYSRLWNEDRIADPKLLARTPFRLAIARDMAAMAWHEGLDPRAFINYASGFAKLNNRDRFEADHWEGESQFDREVRPSATAVAKRIAYLYPDGTPEAALPRYIAELDRLIATSQARGARVVIVKMPLPQSFGDRLPKDDQGEAALSALFAKRGVQVFDFSARLRELKFYFDTDHLNRGGTAEFFARHLRPVLTGRAD